MCDGAEKEAFDGKFNDLIGSVSPPLDTLISMRDFSVITDANRVICWPSRSGTRNDDNSRLLNFSRTRRLEIADS